MKIIVFVEKFPFFSETFIYNQFKELINRGEDVYLYYLNNSEINVNHSVIKFIEQSGRLVIFRRRITLLLILNLIKFPFKSFLLIKYFQSKKCLFYILNLDFLLKIENSDILHTHFGKMGEFAGIMFKIGVFKKVKLVNSFHGADILPSRIYEYKIKYKNLIKYSSLFISNSEYSYNIIGKIDESIINRLVILPVGVDYPFFFNIDFSRRESFEIIYVGRLVDFKGAINVLKIANKVIQHIENVYFHIVGDGSDYEFLNNYVNEFKLNNFISFHKAISHDQLIELYKKSSIFLLPGITITETGRAENQGLVIQEAQAMCLPVLISDAGGMKEGIINGVSGFVVPENDIDEFCNKILFFYRNRNMIQVFGNAGNNFVLNNYSNYHITDKLIKYYSSI